MVYITYLDRSTPSIKMAILDEDGRWSTTPIVVGEHLFWGEMDVAISDNGSIHMVYLASSVHAQYDPVDTSEIQQLGKILRQIV